VFKETTGCSGNGAASAFYQGWTYFQQEGYIIRYLFPFVQFYQDCQIWALAKIWIWLKRHQPGKIRMNFYCTGFTLYGHLLISKLIEVLGGPMPLYYKGEIGTWRNQWEHYQGWQKTWNHLRVLAQDFDTAVCFSLKKAGKRCGREFLHQPEAVGHLNAFRIQWLPNGFCTAMGITKPVHCFYRGKVRWITKKRSLADWQGGCKQLTGKPIQNSRGKNGILPF